MHPCQSTVLLAITSHLLQIFTHPHDAPRFTYYHLCDEGDRFLPTCIVGGCGLWKAFDMGRDCCQSFDFSQLLGQHGPSLPAPLGNPIAAWGSGRLGCSCKEAPVWVHCRPDRRNYPSCEYITTNLHACTQSQSLWTPPYSRTRDGQGSPSPGT